MSAPPSSPPAHGTPERENQLRSMLLPAFGSPRSDTKTRDLAHSKVEIYRDNATNRDHAPDAFLPTPMPTSEANMQPSSPPPVSNMGQSARPKPASPLQPMLIVRVPNDGEKVTVGRSSKSSNFALRASNRLASRIHASLHYDASQNILSIECFGWNGMSVNVSHNKQNYKIERGQVLNVEGADGVTMDIHGDRALVELSGETQMSDATEDEVWSLMGSSPLKRKRDVNDKENILPRKITDSDKSTLVEDRPETALPKHEMHAEAVSESEAGSADNEIASEKKTNEELAKAAKEEVAKEEAAKEAAKEEVAKEAAEEEVAKETAKEEVAKEEAAKGAAKEELPKEEAAKEAAKEEAAKEAAKEEAAKEEVAEEEAAKGAAKEAAKEEAAKEAAKEELAELENLEAPALINDSTAANDVHQKSTHIHDSRRSRTPHHSRATSRAGSEDPENYGGRKVRRQHEPITESQLENFHNVIANLVAFSRSSAVPLSAVRKSNSTLHTLPKSQVMEIIKGIPCIGIIEGAIEDTTARKADDEYYYIPEKDSSVERRKAVEGARGHRSLRSCRKTSKQYYYRPL